MTRFFQNAAVVHESGGCYTPHRFTDAQIAHFDSLDDVQAACCRSASGIKLAFVTTADEISFDYTAGYAMSARAGFDMYENGILTCQIESEPGQSRGQVVYRCQNQGFKTLEIWLPVNHEVTLSSLSLGDAAPLPVPRPQLLFLGDSITQGCYVTHASMPWPIQYARHCGAECRNMGVGKAEFDPAHLDHMPQLSPDRIFVAYGANDLAFGGTVAQCIEQACTFLEKLKSLYPGVGITLIAPIWADYPYVPGRRREYRELLHTAALQLGCEVADGDRLVPHLPAYFSDGVHPGDLGYTLYALNLLDGKTRLS